MWKQIPRVAGTTGWPLGILPRLVKLSSYWRGADGPQCLPDVVEAYVGAIFVDSEFNYHEVERFFEQHMKWFFEDMSIYDSYASSHPTVSAHFQPSVKAKLTGQQTHLSTLLTLSFNCNHFRILSDELPSLDGTTVRVVAVVMIHNQIIAEGLASSGKNAKIKASSNALGILRGLAPFEYRSQYRCNCEELKDGEDENETLLGGGTVGDAI